MYLSRENSASAVRQDGMCKKKNQNIEILAKKKMEQSQDRIISEEHEKLG